MLCDKKVERHVVSPDSYQLIRWDLNQFIHLNKTVMQISEEI